jgi:predicted nucleic acid-binding protein
MIAFFDTNVLVYAVAGDRKQLPAGRILAQGGLISTHVLNEFASVAHKKLRKSWIEIEYAIGRFCELVDAVVPLTLTINATAIYLARDHGFSFYDALIVAAALEAGRDTLFTEDMQDGRVLGGLTIRNPFLASPS